MEAEYLREQESESAGVSGFSQLEDKVMKTAAQFFGKDLLPYVGIKGRIACVAPTEHVHLEMRKLEEDAGVARRSKIGTGDRSEKIRTYNYPQNRVTDQRIGLTINQLDRIMEGKLGDVLDALEEYDQKLKLAGEK